MYYGVSVWITSWLARFHGRRGLGICKEEVGLGEEKHDEYKEEEKHKEVGVVTVLGAVGH